MIPLEILPWEDWTICWGGGGGGGGGGGLKSIVHSIIFREQAL